MSHSNSSLSAARRPLIWSIAGTDSGGGAGLAADQRAAQAMGVHLCPVVAAVTAQNSVAVEKVCPVAPEVLLAQLQTLAHDMPPRVIKTGLLGGVEQVKTVARIVDTLRQTQGPVALVVDPVLGSSTGAGFCDEATLEAYRQHLLPRATLVTPNLSEAARLLGSEAASAADAPSLARQLQALGCESVCITGGDQDDALASDWMLAPHASGWLQLPRLPRHHLHGTGCTFATSAAAAMALGFVSADALVLAKMATAHAIALGYAAGQGRGPVCADREFAVRPECMPILSWDETAAQNWPSPSATPIPFWGLYAITDDAAAVERICAAGAGTVQLRLKTPTQPSADWLAHLRAEVRASIESGQRHGVRIVINDHWELALQQGAAAVHLGQEDLLQMGASGRLRLLNSGVALGISSHSLWELARARSLRPAYVACGPVWPTTTKDMPWIPQGLDNLAWWVHMAGAPVVAIGGILEPQQVEACAQTRAAGVCVLRALGQHASQTVPRLKASLAQGRSKPSEHPSRMPHSSLIAPGVSHP